MSDDDLNNKILLSLHDPLAMSREYALLGNYDTALIHFDSVMKLLGQYIATLSSDSSKRAR